MFEHYLFRPKFEELTKKITFEFQALIRFLEENPVDPVSFR